MKTLDELKLTDKQKEVCLKLNLHNSDDILQYYPFRYEQLEVKKYSDWKVNDKVVIEGRLCSYPNSFRFKGNRTVTHFKIETDDEIFEISLFNRAWIKSMPMDSRLTIIGKYMGNRKITAINYNTKPLIDQLKIQSIYPLKEGINQKQIRDIIMKTYKNIKEEIENDIPNKYLKKYRLIDKSLALNYIHFPSNKEEVHAAYRHLKYEEFLKFYLTIQLIKNEEHNVIVKDSKKFNYDDVFSLANHLSFTLTNDQIKAVNDILFDLQSNRIMYRLVQGDVGCGKTLVAALGLYACILSGKQAAFMAPTEILAKQHYYTLKKLFKNQHLKTEVLYSSLNNTNKKIILDRLANGDIDLLVGTHALFSNDVKFKDLGMVVADEQQRFGVEQRKKLKEKGDKVDFLLMSATPIPRTLASTLYGDMDISTIETMPLNRQSCKTIFINQNSMYSIINDIYEILRKNQQVYVVCSAIEDNENYSGRNVNDIYNSLSKEFYNYQVGLLHGKMSSDEKEKIMNDFNENKIQILVSTTVIEVGVNVENATCMIIYDAHRFGLSQLHQLRGRVKRGSHAGVCYLLSDTKDEEAIKRLQVLVDLDDGFKIAYEDLKLRGPGDILGTRQSGLPNFVLGNLINDENIAKVAKMDALEIINEQKEIELLNKINEINKTNILYYD